ncbi:MAG: hypothetical protein M5U14_12180 [Acidimicrobiia bacterium]|nr:hypothetical protein [Acidimicrobiia bacterium]
MRAAKLAAFAVSAFLAGVGGALLAYERQRLSVDSFTVFLSLSLIALTYLGGIASVSGALVAGALAQQGLLTTFLDRGGGSGSRYQFAVSGLALIVAAILYREGVTGAVRAAWRRLRPRAPARAPTPGVAVAPAPAGGSRVAPGPSPLHPTGTPATRHPADRRYGSRPLSPPPQLPRLASPTTGGPDERSRQEIDDPWDDTLETGGDTRWSRSAAASS